MFILTALGDVGVQLGVVVGLVVTGEPVSGAEPGQGDVDDVGLLAEADETAEFLGLDLVEEVVEPGKVPVVDDVEAVGNAGGLVQLLAEGLEHGLELLLGGVGRPGVDPVLDDLLAELALDVLAVDRVVDRGHVLEGLAAHSAEVADTLVELGNRPGKKTKSKEEFMEESI